MFPVSKNIDKLYYIIINFTAPILELSLKLIFGKEIPPKFKFGLLNEGFELVVKLISKHKSDNSLLSYNFLL